MSTPCSGSGIARNPNPYYGRMLVKPFHVPVQNFEEPQIRDVLLRSRSKYIG